MRDGRKMHKKDRKVKLGRSSSTMSSAIFRGAVGQEDEEEEHIEIGMLIGSTRTPKTVHTTPTDCTPAVPSIANIGYAEQRVTRLRTCSIIDWKFQHHFFTALLHLAHLHQRQAEGHFVVHPERQSRILHLRCAPASPTDT